MLKGLTTTYGALWQGGRFSFVSHAFHFKLKHTQ